MSSEPKRSLATRAAALLVGGGAIVLALGFPGAAAAAPANAKTTTAFIGTSTVTTGFGGDWSLHLRVSTAGAAITSEDGTVDVTVAGLAGTWASGLPISGNGDVYLSPPDGKPGLGAGAHQLTAFFRPAAGSGLAASQTTSAASVTVSALTATAKVAVTGVADLAPQVHLSLDGSWQSTTKTSPPGSWSVDVTGPDKTVAFSTKVTQPTSSTDPIVVPVTARLARGTDYSVLATFTPDSAVAKGLTLTQQKAVTFHSPDLQLAEMAAKPIAVQAVFLVLALALLVGLVVASILVARATRRRRSVGEAATAPE